MASTLSNDLLDVLDKLAGGVHAGFRPAHARGMMYSGTFTPSPEAAKLTRAPHANRPSTPVTVRFSLSAGIPTVADNDPKGSSPQGMAVRFHLGEHVHTDIVAHSHNGFPARNGEEFLEFLRAAAASGPGATNPPPIVAFLASHSGGVAFVEAARSRSPAASFARQSYFALTAFKFTNAAGRSRFGRFRLHPDPAGTETLDCRASREEAGRLPVRRAVGAPGQGAGQVPLWSCSSLKTCDVVSDVYRTLAGDAARGGVRHAHHHGKRSTRSRSAPRKDHLRPAPPRGRHRLRGRPADRSAFGPLPAERPAASDRAKVITAAGGVAVAMSNGHPVTGTFR